MNLDPSFHRRAVARRGGASSSSSSFLCSAEVLRSLLGWTLRAFSGCSARSSGSWTAEVTLAAPVEMISPAFELQLVSAGATQVFTVGNNLDPARQSLTP